MEYDFNSGKRLLEYPDEMSISQLMLARESQLKEEDESKLRQEMHHALAAMGEGIAAGLEEELRSMGGLVNHDGAKLLQYTLEGKSLAEGCLGLAVARAMAAVEWSACMGKIVAAPTAGAGGVLPGVLLTVAESRGWDDEKLVDGLFTAAGIGYIIAKRATVSGAEGGCQAETGSAAAMAAAALVEMAGGSKAQALDAAAMALKNVMGLVCDPVAGLVEVPCVKRNALGAANALICADMALAGCRSFIPFDEVVDAMALVGKSLPHELRETALGGLAATPTAQAMAREWQERK